MAPQSIVERFEVLADAPYRRDPFGKRNWGHPLHSLCSYQGKLKPALAYWLVKQVAGLGESVLDPLGGVGTVAFEAALSGRRAVSNDMSPLPSIVAAGKLNPPTRAEIDGALDALARAMAKVELCEQDFESANFGLNARVRDYYHPRTLEEILRARRLLLTGVPLGTCTDFVFASLLHVLHGNRPYALSRNSHPITPFNPSGEAEYRSLQEKVRARIGLMLRHPLPPEFLPGTSLNVDFRELPTLLQPGFDTIITSPPFLGMRFDRPNWLRLWFCGWGERDFHETSRAFLERQQLRSRDCYQDFFASCAFLLKPRGLLVVHIGRGGRDDMAEDLRVLADDRFQLLNEVVENVQDVEQHGILDKGRTTHHHLLLFAKRQ